MKKALCFFRFLWVYFKTQFFMGLYKLYVHTRYLTQERIQRIELQCGFFEERSELVLSQFVGQAKEY